MAGYSPLHVTAPETGLVQNRQEFILPSDAYPVLQNAYLWRERILRKKGYQFLGRLQRSVTDSLGNTDGSGNFSGSILTILSLQPATGSLVPGSFTATIGANTFTEPTSPNGGLLKNGVLDLSSSINYSTSQVVLSGNAPATAVNATFNYYPGLPVMGIRTQELTNSENDQTIFFDQVYAYTYNDSTKTFQEFIPGTTWNAHSGSVTSVDFFWSTNYWVSSAPLFGTSNKKLFWETNNTGQFGLLSDPPRITDGSTWLSWWTSPGGIFTPGNWTQLDSTNYLVNWLCMLPFRGRMVVFNTWEGANTTSASNYSNRIRWSTIGNPFIAYSAGPPATGSWRDDIRGQGGYLDIPTSEDITSIGFVRDNLVIYCERSTWQLRYTGRSIAPFQIERVNSELGAESPFSSVQFDTTLIGIGDKGVVECDSYQSQRIDIKIPDFVFKLQGNNNATYRIQGIRDFLNRLAFWTVVYDSPNSIFPNTRLVYNYENDSWALFTDSLTALGTYQPVSGRNWLNTNLPWIECNFTWIDQPAEQLSIVGGNQQGFIEYLDRTSSNDASLFITGITGNTTTPTTITSPNHNLQTGDIISINEILSGTAFSSLNGSIFSVIVTSDSTFNLMKYNSGTKKFDIPQLDSPDTYIGGGVISVRDNFVIKSKKFNFLEDGQNIQLGYIDILTNATQNGAFSLNLYINYDDENATNILPQNQINNGNEPREPDPFFNAVIPTSPSTYAVANKGTKFWQRVFCPSRANFITLEYTLSNGQMAGNEQTQPIQIDAQVLWTRKAGRMCQL